MVSALMKAAFDPYYVLPQDTWDEITGNGEILTYRREEILKKVNTTEKYLYFIIRGSAGILLWNKNNFVCTDIIFDRDFVCDYLSFITRQSTPYQVIAFEDAEMFRISHERFDQFTRNNPSGDKIWRYATQALYVEKHYQQLQLLTMSASERYGMILQHQQFVLQRIPQKYIASYLGVTPQSLSRLRKPNLRD